MLCLSKIFEEKMKALLGERYDLYVSSLSEPPLYGLRVNTLKIRVQDFLPIAPARLSSSPFCAEGFYVNEEKQNASRHPFHHAGLYYMQEPSATSAVTVLAPQPGDKVLDLCAAPGGKSTQIAAALAGEGLLVSNEYVSGRVNALLSNLERMGVVNAVVLNSETGLIAQKLPLYFDKVLVDAPCSGEGMFKKEPQALAQWSQSHVEACAQRQKEILHNGACCVREGGVMVYSTCTFSREENEDVVEDFLKTHPDFILLPSQADFGQPGFDREGKTRRIFPFHHGEGHFIARFQRVSGGWQDGQPYEYQKLADQGGLEMEQEILAKPHPGILQRVGENLLFMPKDLPSLSGLHVVRCGVLAGAMKGRRFQPAHNLCMSAGAFWRQTVNLPADSPLLAKFLHGETLEVDPQFKGYAAVLAQGYPVGFGKAVGGTLKNHYPKGLRTV